MPSDAADHLHAAADCLDDARTDLERGDLDADGGEIERLVETTDDLASTLRELAIFVETLEDSAE